MKHEYICEAITKLEELGHDFHGHRSEIWCVLEILFAQGEKSGIQEMSDHIQGCLV